MDDAQMLVDDYRRRLNGDDGAVALALAKRALHAESRITAAMMLLPPGAQKIDETQVIIFKPPEPEKLLNLVRERLMADI